MCYAAVLILHHQSCRNITKPRMLSLMILFVSNKCSVWRQIKASFPKNLTTF